MIIAAGLRSDLKLIVYINVTFAYPLVDGFAVAREQLELTTFRIYWSDKNEAICVDHSIE